MNKLPPAAASLLAQARADDRAHRVDVERSLATLTASLPFADGPGPLEVPQATTQGGLQGASGFGTAQGALFAGKGIKLFLATVALGGTIGGGAWIGLGREQRPTAREVARAPVAAPPHAARAESAPERAQPARTGPAAAQVPGAPHVIASHASPRAHLRPAPRGAHAQGTHSAHVALSSPPAQAPRRELAASKSAARAETPTPEAPQTAHTRSPRVADPLELDLIDEALTSLRADAPQVALTKLEQHESLYAQGKFAIERRGLRVLALCRLGRAEQALRERAAFLAAHPGAPIAARVRQACSTGEH